MATFFGVLVYIQHPSIARIVFHIPAPTTPDTSGNMNKLCHLTRYECVKESTLIEEGRRMRNIANVLCVQRSVGWLAGSMRKDLTVEVENRRERGLRLQETSDICG